MRKYKSEKKESTELESKLIYESLYIHFMFLFEFWIFENEGSDRCYIIKIYDKNNFPRSDERGLYVTQELSQMVMCKK